MSKQKSYRALIVCCGRMDRGDDAIGPLCANALQDRKIPSRTLRGDASELLDAWRTAQHVIMVDAIVTGQAVPGTLLCLDSRDENFQPQAARCSSTGTGLVQAMKLGPLLKCMPSSMLLMGLEASHFEWASTLSQPVAAALPDLIDAVIREWQKLVPPRVR